MILVTVGAQMPFDRLVAAVDAWAARQRRADVFAQIGRGGTPPKHFASVEMLDAETFRRRVLEADAVVTHAGVGTVLTALELGTPLLLFPRRGDLAETRNDHQLATAAALGDRAGVRLAWDEAALATQLDEIGRIERPRRIPSHASIRLLSSLRRFIRPGAVIPAAGVSGVSGVIGPSGETGRRRDRAA